MESGELELLIKKITAEVTQSLLMQPEGLSAIKDLPSMEDKMILVLIPEFVEDLESFIDYLKKKHPGYQLVLGVHGKVDVPGLQQIREVINIEDGSSRQKLTSMINKFDASYLICPEVMQVKALADGDDRGFAEKLIIYFVLHGKDTGIILDYDIWEMPSNSFVKKLKELYGSLKDMGISIEVLNGSQEDTGKVESGKGKALITEKDVEEMFRKGINTIRVGNESIITPLAKDKANELKIKLT